MTTRRTRQSKRTVSPRYSTNEDQSSLSAPLSSGMPDGSELDMIDWDALSSWQNDPDTLNALFSIPDQAWTETSNTTESFNLDLSSSSSTTSSPARGPTFAESTGSNGTDTSKAVPMDVQVVSEYPSPFTLPTSPASSPQEHDPKSEDRVTRRRNNTLAARRYRQRKLDRMYQLEEELEAVISERDELKMRVHKLIGETTGLKQLLGLQKPRPD